MTAQTRALSGEISDASREYLKCLRIAFTRFFARDGKQDAPMHAFGTRNI